MVRLVGGPIEREPVSVVVAIARARAMFVPKDTADRPEPVLLFG
jgi:hypothetical protein